MPVNSISTRPNPVLTNIVQGYKPEGFVADEILPAIPVRAYVGDINVDGAEHFRVHDTNVSFNGKTPLLKLSMARTTGWRIQEHSIKAMITEADAANQFPGDPEAGRRELRSMFAIKVANAEMVRREDSLMTAITTTGNYTLSNTVTLAGTSQYSDYTNSTPLSDFKTARQRIHINSGTIANVAVMEWDTFQTLIDHPQLVGRLNVSSDRTGGLSIEELASAMKVRKIVISTAQKNTAAEGQPASMTPIMDKSIVFMYVDAAPVANMPSISFGYSFKYKEKFSDSWTDLDPRGEFVRVSEYRDDVILSYKAAYLIKNAIA